MDAPQEETETQRQARLRRERRNAKIQAQGASRLEAITSLSGRPAPAPESPSQPQAQAPPKPPPAPVIAAPQPTTGSDPHHPDPDEVDISEHYWQPESRGGSGVALTPSAASPSPRPQQRGADNGGPDDDPMMRLLQQMMGGAGGPGDVGGPGGAGEDPMLKLMQQMMGGGAGAGGAGGFPGMPGMPGQQQGQGQGQQAAPPSSAYVWRVVHAVFSFALAAYIALASTFNGSKLSRSQSVVGEGLDGGIGQRLFWIFATFEVVLQSTRYFLEKGQLQQSGIMGTLGSMLPEPYAGYLRLIGRYSTIYTTVVADAMIVVFVLGAMAWWKDLVVT